MASLITSSDAQGPNLTSSGEIVTGYDNYPPFFDMAIGTNSSGGIRYHAVWSDTSVQFSEKVYYAYSDSNATWTIVGDDNTVGDPIYDNDGDTDPVAPSIFISGDQVIICVAQIGRHSDGSYYNSEIYVQKRIQYGNTFKNDNTFAELACV